MINYDGRRFSPVTSGPRPVACYHQQDELIWGEFAGAEVRRGSLVGVASPDGMIRFGYCMALADGSVLLGDCRSVPELLADGRIRLTEYWQRYGVGAGSGISYLEELPAARDGLLEARDSAAGGERQPTGPLLALPGRSGAACHFTHAFIRIFAAMPITRFGPLIARCRSLQGSSTGDPTPARADCQPGYSHSVSTKPVQRLS